MCPLPLKYNPDLFNKELTSKKGGLSKTYCEKVREKVNVYITKLLDDGKEINPQDLKDFIQRGCADKTYTLNDMFAGFLAIQNERVGTEISQEMYDRYVTAKDKFYKDLKLDGTEAAESIIFDDLVKYKAKQLKQFKESTVATYLNKIKAVFRYAFNAGKIGSFPFDNIVIKKGYSDDEVKFLTDDELDRIKDKEFSTERLTKVKDCFLFQCYSGLAYIDMKMLVKDDVKFDNRTKLYYINKPRHKTKVKFFSILLGSAVEIITKYDFKLPVPSNQKMNAYLKEIQDLCGIDIVLTSHVGRHTYATQLLSNGFTIEQVAQCLGHDPSDTKITARYAKIYDTTLLDNAGKIQKKLIKKEIEKILLEK